MRLTFLVKKQKKEREEKHFSINFKSSINTKEMIHETRSDTRNFFVLTKMSIHFSMYGIGILYAKHVLRGTQLIHNFVWTSTRERR